MERPEALDAGCIILSGLEAGIVLDSIALTIAEHGCHQEREIPSEYTITNTSWRVLKLVLGTAKLSNVWAGIKDHS